jgi:uncharacterized protein (TIGR00369 family)
MTNNHNLANLPEAAGLSGKELMQAMIEGRLPGPSIANTMSFRLVQVGDGFAIFEGEPGAHLLNPMGTIHGGWALALIDSAAGCAAHTLLPAGAAYTTIETKVNFSRPITIETGCVRCEGRVISQGRQIISAQAQLLAQDGRILAHGTSTLMVLNPGSGPTPPPNPDVPSR